MTTDFKDRDVPPMWLTVISFGKLADRVSELVKKGALVLVSGRLAVREYTDKNNVTRQSVEVIAQNVQVMPIVSRERPEREPVAEDVRN